MCQGYKMIRWFSNTSQRPNNYDTHPKPICVAWQKQLCVEGSLYGLLEWASDLLVEFKKVCLIAGKRFVWICMVCANIVNIIRKG